MSALIKADLMTNNHEFDFCDMNPFLEHTAPVALCWSNSLLNAKYPLPQNTSLASLHSGVAHSLMNCFNRAGSQQHSALTTWVLHDFTGAFWLGSA